MRPKMRAALEQAAKNPIRRVHDGPGKPAWEHSPASLHALVRRGWLEYSEGRNKHGARIEAWTITDAGKKALLPPDIHRVEQPIYMSRGSVRFKVLPSKRWAVDEDTEASGDYTTDPRKSIDQERAPGAKSRVAVPVLVRPDDLDEFTRSARRREHEEKRTQGERLDAQPATERINRLERVAGHNRTTIASELRLIRHMLSKGRETHALRRIEQLETNLGQRAA